jgi:hypothetical protein
VWELYDVRSDFSLSNDLAAANPEKLAEMQALFLDEATRNNVLPIDDRTFERLTDPVGVGRPDLFTGRESITLAEGMTGMLEPAFPNVKNRSITLDADIVVPEGGAHGTVIAQGGRFGGWSLYVKDGVPGYRYNFLGLQTFDISASDALAAGNANIRLEFVYDGGGPGKGGTAALFVNGAQVIIDQFISSSESKWLRMSGLVMLLPHGYEGQGPEHSSARPERFLQMCAEDNWQIANCTTPANYFHILRRQMLRDFRKPLIMMTPKSLLRHKLAVSPIDMFGPDSTFHRVLWDDDQQKLAKPEKIKRVVLCSGKVYYDLLQERRERKIDNVMILRLEQLYPFPDEALETELSAYKNAEIVWCQEEPKNQGYWQFVDPFIEDVLIKMKHKGVQRAKFVGRKAAAAPATGLMKRHNIEQAKLVDEALSI